MVTDTEYLVLTPGAMPEVPITWDTPAAYKSGIYTWSIKFNVFPIPFLDQWIVQLIAGRQDDEDRVNQIIASEGATGTATILEKTLTKHKNWLGNIDSFTIHYKVAFTGDIAPLGAKAALFPWVVLVPYIPAILGVISLIIIGLIINNITSTIKSVAGPQCYTPREPGVCADGWFYNADTGLCCTERKLIPWVPLLLAGGVLLILTQSN